ncbi:hypothetical protein Cob_v003035 [Colletotrichum orbiculare MAFF 240422]|uniref:Polymer-forming cytoskeletal protein n=1 Tax=Colletotrichum orbiculare (strain 104-T / ATCC 96160 / CBS 514.97 / LARS 414 / MAFF 240422) TaxID=1213857 RepID=A0A484G248_COLOR|nr:hypothetical protein Cob_v003035 [Colletotrichum orbiculare MAFF 240422]
MSKDVTHLVLSIYYHHVVEVQVIWKRAKIKTYGNIAVNGHLSVKDNMQGFGKLKVTGTCEVAELEIYGNTIIHGFLKCQTMTLYGSLTLIGPESGYWVDGEEKVWGALLSRDEYKEC